MAGRKKADTPAETDSETSETEVAATPEADTTETEVAEAGAENTDAPTEDETGDAAESEADTSEQNTEDATPEPAEAAPEPAPEPKPEPKPEPAPAQSGPGFLPLLIGGIVAGAIGYGAASFQQAQSGGSVSDQVSGLEATLTEQQATMTNLADQTAAVETALAEFEPPEVDLSGVESALADMASRADGIDTALSALTGRVDALEARPVLTGEGTTDEAAMAAAMAELRATLSEQQSENAALAEDIRALASDAEARIAEAEERAEANAGSAAARAALSELQIALAAGTPFAAPLADWTAAQGIDAPEALTEVAESGIPTLEELQARYPAAARAALPIALREVTAEAGLGDRLLAFAQGQVGGRSLEPREGGDPDAILSRVEAAVEVGDLTGALEELSALPDPAIAAMSDWIGLTATRSEALSALDDLAAGLGQN